MLVEAYASSSKHKFYDSASTSTLFVFSLKYRARVLVEFFFLEKKSIIYESFLESV